MIDMLTRSYSNQNNDQNQVAINDRERNYDRLKQQCDTAIHDLMLLRRYIIFLMSNLKII